MPFSLPRRWHLPALFLLLALQATGYLISDGFAVDPRVVAAHPDKLVVDTAAYLLVLLTDLVTILIAGAPDPLESQV